MEKTSKPWFVSLVRDAVATESNEATYPAYCRLPGEIFRQPFTADDFEEVLGESREVLGLSFGEGLADVPREVLEHYSALYLWLASQPDAQALLSYDGAFFRHQPGTYRDAPGEELDRAIMQAIRDENDGGSNG